LRSIKIQLCSDGVWQLQGNILINFHALSIKFSLPNQKQILCVLRCWCRFNYLNLQNMFLIFI